MPFRVTTFRNAWVLYAPVRRQRMSRPDWAGLASGIIATVKMKSIMGASGTANSSQLFARRRDVSKPRRESTFKRPAAISPEGLLPAEKPRKRPSHGSGPLATPLGNFPRHRPLGPVRPIERRLVHIHETARPHHALQMKMLCISA